MPKKKRDKNKTQEKLMKELAEMRQRVAELEKTESERNRTIEMLQESEKQYRQIFENASEAISLLDRKGKFITINPAAASFFKGAPSDFEGKTLHDILPKLEAEKNIGKIKQLIETGEGLAADVEVELKDGKRWFHSSLQPIKDESGHVIAALNLSTDITERKQAEEAIREQDERIKAAIESSSDGILMVDDTGKAIHANASFARMWHIPEDLMATRDDNKLLAHVLDQLEDPQAFLSKVQRLYQSPDQDFDTLTFKDGRIFERFSFPLMRRGKVAGRVWSFRDATERKRAEQEKKKLEEQLRHSQKMEAIGTLAGGIAHDFNNILGAIIGYTELASDDLPDDSITKENLSQVLVAANRAKDMVKQILAFSRKDKEDRNPILLSEIAHEALKLLRSSLPTTIDIRSNISSQLTPVFASQTQINQVIMNLCTNAAHAMREKGGILEMTLKEIDLDPDILDVKDLASGRYQQLSISDTGHGIAPEIKDRIFEPFFTTKKTGEGTGMGLAMVYGIVKGHGGEITVYSEPGKGTTVHVYLPVLGERAVTEGEIDDAEPVIGGSERILFVDDEPHLAEVGKQMLEKLGYRVTSRTSSTEALENFRSNPSFYDLVITDQTMPDMTGVQLVGELKQIRPGIPVILCTGFSEKISERDYESRGIAAFVMKPTVKKEIARVIRRVLDKNTA